MGEVDAVWTQRISYAGELGWELYGQIAMGQRAWDVLWQAGREHGIVAAGGGAFDSLRLEKGYRLWGQDIHTEHDPFEAGLGFAVRMDKGSSRGREALQRIARPGPRPRSSLPHPRRPHRRGDGQGADRPRRPGRLLRHERRVRVLDRAGIVYGYLPVELAVEGMPVEVEYFGDRLAATVAAEPLWDPKGERLRAEGSREKRERTMAVNEDPGITALHEDAQVAVLPRLAEARRRPLQRLQPRTTLATTATRSPSTGTS